MITLSRRIVNDVTAYDFDGSDYLSVGDHADWDFGTGDFTIDFWMNIDASASHRLCAVGTFSSGGIAIIKPAANTLDIYVNSGSATKSNAWNPSLNTWYHVAVVRSGSNLHSFINGTELGSSVSNSSSIAVTTGVFVATWAAGSSEKTQGRIDEFRVSNTARWTTNFTPASKQYRSDSNTKLLIHCGETKTGTTGSGATFTDSGNTGHTVTENGDAIEDTTTYKF